MSETWSSHNGATTTWTSNTTTWSGLIEEAKRTPGGIVPPEFPPSRKEVHAKWDEVKANRAWRDSLPEVLPRDDFVEYAVVAIGAAMMARHADDVELMCSCAREAAAHILAGTVATTNFEDPSWFDNNSDREILRHAALKTLGADDNEDERLPYAAHLLRVLCARYDGDSA